MHAANAGWVVKTKTAEHYAGAKKGIGGCFGKSATVGDLDEHDLPSERLASRADLAAAGELNSLADVRETEAEEDFEDGRSEQERHSQPFRQRFGVRFSQISDHLPSVTHRLPRFARSSRDKDSAKSSVEASQKKESQGRDLEGTSMAASHAQSTSGQPEAAPVQPQAGQPAAASGQPESRQSADPQVSNSSQAPQAPCHVYPGQLSSSPILPGSGQPAAGPAQSEGGQAVSEPPRLDNFQSGQRAAAPGHQASASGQGSPGQVPTNPAEAAEQLIEGHHNYGAGQPAAMHQDISPKQLVLSAILPKTTQLPSQAAPCVVTAAQ